MHQLNSDNHSNLVRLYINNHSSVTKSNLSKFYLLR